METNKQSTFIHKLMHQISLRSFIKEINRQQTMYVALS